MHSKSPSNHWVPPTAASFGWTDIAAAADPLRYAHRSNMKIIVLALCLYCPRPAQAAPSKKSSVATPAAATATTKQDAIAISSPAPANVPIKWKDPSWITAASTLIYMLFTGGIILQQRKSRLDDKLPCIVVRARMNPSRLVQGGRTRDEWKLRLINIGVGPAFIEHFETKGLPSLVDGDHTQVIDRVVGAEVGDPDQQVDFADGTPDDIRREGTQFVIRYKDIAGRSFETRIVAGQTEFVRCCNWLKCGT